VASRSTRCVGWGRRRPQGQRSGARECAAEEACGGSRPRQGDPARGVEADFLSPSRRREAIEQVRRVLPVSEAPNNGVLDSISSRATAAASSAALATAALRSSIGSRPSFTIWRALAANSRATASDTSASAPKPISRRFVWRLNTYTHLVGRPSVMRRYRPPPPLYPPAWIGSRPCGH